MYLGQVQDPGIYSYTIRNGFNLVGQMDSVREDIGIVSVPSFYIDYAENCIITRTKKNT